MAEARVSPLEKEVILLCRLCSSELPECFAKAEIMGMPVSYFDCSVCGYVQTEAPSWLDKAYLSPINNSDTGIMVRNQENVGVVLATLSMLDRMHGVVVDCAGGYGILVRMLRDRGVEAFWSDPYCNNLFAVGFEYITQARPADLVTAFEAFEHFVDPLLEVKKFFEIAPNLLLTTNLIPGPPAPSPDQWWYYGLNHGQHIGFFRIKSLQFIANRFGKNLITDGKSLHLFTEYPINSTLWILKTKIAKRFPSLFARKLQSKTWSDSEKVSANYTTDFE